MASGPPRRSSTPPSAGVRLSGRALRIGDRELPLYSGAMHYWRLEPEDWATGLRQLKALGLEIVETYVPWQVHETAGGGFDFGERDRRKDLARFLDLAGELDLVVFARPGPHINAEMTYFGLPERVVFDRSCQARSPEQNPVLQGFPPRFFPVPSYASRAFLEEVRRWLEAVGEILAPRMAPEGPVALLQVDNEGSYYFRDGSYDQDYHPDAVAAWQRHLAARYGSPEAASLAHGRVYESFGAIDPPRRFDAEDRRGLVRHLDWARFKERLLTIAMGRFGQLMEDVGLHGVPTVHNLPLGEVGSPVSAPALEAGVVDLVGADYYHARREQWLVKRRTLLLAGTHALPYAVEMGAGAPPWFTPLGHEDSLVTLMTALAYGLRGFNLYMAVDRDRWYGAPIDDAGNPRLEARVYKRLLAALRRSRFHQLRRRTPVGLVLPREYAQLSRVTSLLGFVSPTIFDATGFSPVEACREDDLGFDAPIQIEWWRWITRFAEGLTAAQIPYAFVDGDAATERLEAFEVLVTPSYEFACPDRWKRFVAFAQQDGRELLYGPRTPGLDLRLEGALFQVPRHSRHLADDGAVDAAIEALVERFPPRYAVSPPPVEVAMHEDDAGPQVLFVLNPSKSALLARVDLGAEVDLEDLVTGERFSGRGGTLAVPMAGWSVRMLGWTKGVQSGEAAAAG
jgi:beta-galactosidase